jgi:hypothetical protein
MMKHLFLPLVALLGSMMSSGHAFTLDAAGYEGAGLLRDPMSLRIPGYGEVVFESGFGTPLVVASGYQTVAVLGGLPLCFDPQEAVKISVKDQSGAARAGGEPDLQLVVDVPEAEPEAQNSVWQSIPEPAAAGLGLVGLLLLLLGRRR